MRRSLLWATLMLALMAWGVAVRVEARVFKIAGISFGGGSFDYTAIGKRLYKAAMEVDGRKVDVCVIRAEERGAVLAGLIQSVGGQVLYSGGEGMGMGEIRNGGERTRLLTLPVTDGGGSLVMVVQSPEVKGVTEPPQDPLIAGVPVYRGALLRRVMRNADTGTSLRQAATPDNPRMVMAYYRDTLTRDGWSLVLPAGEAELVCYAKGAEQCWIFCRRPESAGETQLTVVNRRGGRNGTMGDR
jgi:hypothetical protein